MATRDCCNITGEVVGGVLAGVLQLVEELYLSAARSPPGLFCAARHLGDGYRCDCCICPMFSLENLVHLMGTLW